MPPERTYAHPDVRMGLGQLGMVSDTISGGQHARGLTEPVYGSVRRLRKGIGPQIYGRKSNKQWVLNFFEGGSDASVRRKQL